LSSFLDYPPPLSRNRILSYFQIIRGADLDGLVVRKYTSGILQVREDMIPPCEHIETEVFHSKNVFLDRSLPSGDILGVSYHEIGSVFCTERVDILLHHPAAGSSEYISKDKNLHKNSTVNKIIMRNYTKTS